MELGSHTWVHMLHHIKQRRRGSNLRHSLATHGFLLRRLRLVLFVRLIIALHEVGVAHLHSFPDDRVLGNPEQKSIFLIRVQFDAIRCAFASVDTTNISGMPLAPVSRDHSCVHFQPGAIIPILLGSFPARASWIALGLSADKKACRSRSSRSTETPINRPFGSAAAFLCTNANLATHRLFSRSRRRFWWPAFLCSFHLK
mmetsp:Transcript_27214/g.50822  ORF Transcript_27214/g.50822 Transcript_27214/m.50822 type:complete len:200 (-) Transcript_27214:279-878(-)